MPVLPEVRGEKISDLRQAHKWMGTIGRYEVQLYTVLVFEWMFLSLDVFKGRNLRLHNCFVERSVQEFNRKCKEMFAMLVVMFDCEQSIP